MGSRLLHWMCLVPLVSAAQRASTAGEFDVRSENRRYVAQVRRAEVGRPDPAKPRHELSVFAERDDGTLGKRWSAPYVKRASSALCLLSDDGSTFIRVADSTSADGPIVEVIVKGLSRAAFNAEDLELGAGKEGEPWLATDTQSLRIRPAGELNSNACFDLLGRDGHVRTIDLETGSLHVATSRTDTTALPAPPEDIELSPTRVCVDLWSAPQVVRADEALPVQVHGNFPTPGWVLVGFALEVPRANELVLVPCVVPPPANTIGAQVVVGFDSTARIEGLAAGKYSLAVANCDKARAEAPRALEVLPADLLASLDIAGDGELAGRTVTVYWDGRASVATSGAPPRVFLPPEVEIVTLARALRPIEARRDVARSGPRKYELTWTQAAAGSSSSTVRRLASDEASMDSEVRAIVQRLEALQPPPKVRRYELDVHKSTIAVHTSSSGLLKALGHDHKVMVQRLSGEVFAQPDDLSRATLFLEVDAASLAVVDNESEDDRVVIEREMNAKVLESARYPRITFRSNSVAARPKAANAFELTIRGDLSLHGLSREVELSALLELQGDGLRARGLFDLRQSDFRIRPTSAAAGTIKVDDKVKLEFDVTARAE